VAVAIELWFWDWSGRLYRGEGTVLLVLQLQKKPKGCTAMYSYVVDVKKRHKSNQIKSLFYFFFNQKAQPSLWQAASLLLG
jgi:hypothetical protein